MHKYGLKIWPGIRMGMNKLHRLFSSTANDKACGSILFLSPTLWPEPDASAAGVRTSSLLNHFSSPDQPLFQNVHYGSGLTSEPKSTFHNVTMHHIPPNRTQVIKEFLKKSEYTKDLQAVVFDRYFAEEAYSFHFYNERPEVLRILDMQDFHSLRYHRQDMVQRMDKETEIDGSTSGIGLDYFKDDQGFIQNYPVVQDGDSMILAARKNPTSNLLRELASIHRSDLTLVCSQIELDILTEIYGIQKEKLVLAPFFTRAVDNSHDASASSFSTRKDFVTIGGFKHPPNVDQVMLLKQKIWPGIRKKLTDAKLHVYGAYAPPHIRKLHDEKEGFLVHGYVQDLEVLKKHRIMLAPLRYGAGIKGKIVDAWRYGCPVVTTPVGSEGMEMDGRWGGSICQSTDSFVEKAIQTYSIESEWSQSHKNTKLLLERLFCYTSLSRISDAIGEALGNIGARRQVDYTSAMLWYHSARSTEYFSRWIELKEKNK